MRLLILILLSFSLAANATGTNDERLISLQSLNAQNAVHLVFIDVWQDGYSDAGPVSMAQQLEQEIAPGYKVIWVIPRFNITDAQIADFLRATPDINYLFVDESLALMRKHKVRQTPIHILLKNKKEIFRGDTESLVNSIRKGEVL